MQKLCVLLLLILSFNLNAQVGVGTRNPDASAMFQVESNNKGILIPKVALTSASDIATVTSPANGLLIFNTSTTSSSNDSLSPGFYFYNGSEWKRLLNSGDELITTYSAGEGIELDGTSFSINSNVVTNTYTGDIDVTGTITATAFVGDGSGLTGIEIPKAIFTGNATLTSNIYTITQDFVFGSSSLNNVDGTSDDSKFFFDKSKGAFRAGTSSNSEWDHDNIGEYSIAMGVNTQATGKYSTAMGLDTKASGRTSTAMGGFTEASGDYSTALGRSTKALGDYSTAMGAATEASGQSSTAMGFNTQASAKNSLTAGESTLAESRSEFVIGRYNKTTSGVSSKTWITTDPLFTAGNGSNSSNRSNAFQILKNGDATFYSNLSVKKNLDVEGDIDVTGTITATAFVGDGSGLTNVFKGSGDYSTAMGYDTEASGFNSTAIGFYAEASGGHSIAMGVITNASGDYSTAMGYDTEASGYYSTAMGRDTKASGFYSTAMGRFTEASGFYSTAMGHRTQAESFSELVIGQYNKTTSRFHSEYYWDAIDPLFTVGNGSSSSNRSNAFQILKNGDATFYSNLTVKKDLDVEGDIDVTGTITATAFVGDGSGLTGVSIDDASISTSKLADGSVTSSKLSDNTITESKLADESVTNSKVASDAAIDFTKLDITKSDITGLGVPAEDTDTTYSAGEGIELNGTSFSVNSNVVTSTYTGDIDVTGTITATAFVGDGSGLTNVFKGSGDYSTAMGYLSTASGTTSTAMGYDTEATGDYSTAMGVETKAVGHYSTAMGYKTKAESFSEFVIGRFNKTTPDPHPNAWVNGTPLFTVGNGSTSNRSNAFQILKGGNATFYKNLEVIGTLAHSSDIRLKKNIVNISNATETINKLSPKRYSKKTKLTSEEYSIEEMGFIAQDIEKILPFLVTKDNSVDEILSLDYTSFIALLTQGFKEQSAKIEEQSNTLEAQTTKLNQLEERLKSIEKLLNENQP